MGKRYATCDHDDEVKIPVPGKIYIDTSGAEPSETFGFSWDTDESVCKSSALSRRINHQVSLLMDAHILHGPSQVDDRLKTDPTVTLSIRATDESDKLERIKAIIEELAPYRSVDIRLMQGTGETDGEKATLGKGHLSMMQLAAIMRRAAETFRSNAEKLRLGKVKDLKPVSLRENDGLTFIPFLGVTLETCLLMLAQKIAPDMDVYLRSIPYGKSHDITDNEDEDYHQRIAKFELGKLIDKDDVAYPEQLIDVAYRQEGYKLSKQLDWETLKTTKQGAIIVIHAIGSRGEMTLALEVMAINQDASIKAKKVGHMRLQATPDKNDIITIMPPKVGGDITIQTPQHDENGQWKGTFSPELRDIKTYCVVPKTIDDLKKTPTTIASDGCATITNKSTKIHGCEATMGRIEQGTSSILQADDTKQLIRVTTGLIIFQKIDLLNGKDGDPITLSPGDEIAVKKGQKYTLESPNGASDFQCLNLDKTIR